MRGCATLFLQLHEDTMNLHREGIQQVATIKAETHYSFVF